MLRWKLNLVMLADAFYGVRMLEICHSIREENGKTWAVYKSKC